MNDSGLNGGGLFYTFHKANFTDTLEISFNHCMSGADRRIIKLFDKLNNIISQWSFVDKQVLSPMSIPISQLLGHIKVKGELSLVYFDDILPEGRFLLTINSK